MPTDFRNLIPISVAEEVVEALGDRESALMGVARTVQMPSNTEKLPVVSATPTAAFVDPFGGLKPASAVQWAPVTLEAGEIGCVVAVPTAFVNDTEFNVNESIRDELARAFARVFENAALYGTGSPPATWPTGGLTAAAYADAVTGTDELAALDLALSNLEAKGITPDAILGGSALRAALRQQMVTTLQPFTEAPPQVYGVPIVFDRYWNDAVGLALVGGFENVIVGVRTDLTYSISEDAVLTDGAGAIIANLFQSDHRIALQATAPLGVAGTAVKPLSLAKVGVARTAAAKK